MEGRGHRDGPPFGPPGFGRGPRRFRMEFDGPQWGEERPRRRRGDIRTAILTVLAENPGHGYEVIRTLEERSGGMWRPSPGSVYPTLQMLEDEGLVRSQTVEGRRVYEVTDEGRTEAEARARRAGGPPWQGENGGRPEWVQELKGLAGALKQVAVSGNDEQRAAALALVRDARKGIYQLLSQ
jgi:DNA-binding PadR family transcriptional regulator